MPNSIFRKHDSYRYLAECEVDWESLIPKILLSDDSNNDMS